MILITKLCHPWGLWWRGTVLWKWCSQPPTWYGLQLWSIIGESHRLSSRPVWTEHPVILPCWCQKTGSWLCTWVGSRGKGYLVFFGGFALELEEGCFDVYRHGDAHIPIEVLPF